MVKSLNFSHVLTSELLFTQTSEVEQEKCKAELYRRLTSIGFTENQIEKFIAIEQSVITKKLSDEYSNQLLATKKFFDTYETHYFINVEKLTISELFIITVEATNLYPRISAEDFMLYSTVCDFAIQIFAKGRQNAVIRLHQIRLTDDIVKKFIFAEYQIILKVALNDKKVVDAWGNPELYLS